LGLASWHADIATRAGCVALAGAIALAYALLPHRADVPGASNPENGSARLRR
jgi:hypothetical protein